VFVYSNPRGLDWAERAGIPEFLLIHLDGTREFAGFIPTED
jgi:hypothetical protein